jgi:tRNA threonylcarbamoyladenosine biosynthesis protein TsaB
MIPLSDKAYKEKNFEKSAYFEPFYLKDFIATIPKKKIYR